MANSQQYSQEQKMLSLAAISYRGFELVQPGAHKQARMFRAMSKCLHELGPVKDQWEIVWGPASFSPFGLGFADAAMYVAQCRHSPSTYAVAIRGTNPVCLFDWVLHDFIVRKQVAWDYGNPAEVAGAEISFSTALSLNILQHLRSAPPQQSIVRDVEDFVAGAVTSPPAAMPPPERLRGLLSLMPEGDAHFLSKSLEDLNTRLPFQVPGTNRNAWDEAAQRLRSQEGDVSAIIMRLVAEEENFLVGIDLRSFLASKIAGVESAEIYVTGHSKGAALSSTLALWLADTQGMENVPEADRWDPMRKATVHAYSFAGPTAGNGKFAQHSDGVIGARCHRVVNERDIAPCAWAPEHLRQIPDLYPQHHDALQAAVETLLGAFGEMDYAQIGNHVHNLPGAPHSDLFFPEIVYQHLDGYFQQLGLDAEMNAATFFAPLVFSQ
jgi:hypothetical protein